MGHQVRLCRVVRRVQCLLHATIAASVVATVIVAAADLAIDATVISACALPVVVRLQYEHVGHQVRIHGIVRRVHCLLCATSATSFGAAG